MAKCRECRKGNLQILGTAGFDDTIEVECSNPDCGEIYEVEPDGLGFGGMEFVEAQAIEMEREIEDNGTMKHAVVTCPKCGEDTERPIINGKCCACHDEEDENDEDQPTKYQMDQDTIDGY